MILLSLYLCLQILNSITIMFDKSDFITKDYFKKINSLIAQTYIHAFYSSKTKA